MKKFLKILLILVVIIVLLSVALIVAIGASIHDESDNSTPDILNNPKDLTTLINEYAFNALEDVRHTEEISFLMSEYQTNYLLDAVRKEIDVPFINIRSLYSIYNEDSSVSIEAPMSFFGFKSVIRAKLDIVIDTDGTLTVLVSNISVGKLKTESAFVKNVIIKNIKTNQLEKALADQGIYLSLSGEDGIIRATMAKRDIEKTIENLFQDGTGSLYNAIVDELIGNETLMNFHFNDDNAIGLVVYLHELINTRELIYDLESGTNCISSLKNKISTLARNQICNPTNATLLFDYLVRGYDALTDENKKAIESYDLSCIDIKNVTYYEGIIQKSKLTMVKLFLDAAIADPLAWLSVLTDGYYDVSITDANLNELLNSLPFIGTSFAFLKDEQIANITIASLFTEVTDNAMTVYMIMDVNGTNCVFSVDATTIKNSDAVVTLRIESVKLGTQSITDISQKGILQYLSSMLKLDFLFIDAENETISLDFSEYLKDSFFKYLIDNGLSKITVALKSTNGGEVAIRLSRK